jgi:hypothetical protein
MQNLGVSPTGLAVTHTANGPKECNQYPAHFSFPGTNIDLDFNSVIEVDLTGHVINDQQIIALIGRDVLSHTIFVYNGPLGLYSLAL